MNLYNSIVDYFYTILNNFLTAFSTYFDTNFLDYVIPKLNVSIGGLIVQLVSVGFFVLMFIFGWKVFKSIFYLLLGFFRG